MAPRFAAIKQGDAKKLFKAALEAGFGAARIVIHPDGRIEASASFSDPTKNQNSDSEWDDVLR
jgi:hypothetical protein